MEQNEFLEKYIFADFKNLNEDADKESLHKFSEADFEVILQRVEHYGIGIYTLSTWLDSTAFEVAHHEDYKKKATDPKWYHKAFFTFKSRQANLSYAGTYKVSNKLLEKHSNTEKDQ